MRLFSPSTRFFIGYRAFPWSLSSKNLRSKPSQMNQSIKCSHPKDDGVHTWLATVDLNESPQSPEKLDPFSYFFYCILFFFKETKKNHNSCLSSSMRFVNRLSQQNRHLWHKIAFHGKQKKITFHGIQNLSLFLKIYVQWKVRKKFDFLSPCEGGSSDHHF